MNNDLHSERCLNSWSIRYSKERGAARDGCGLWQPKARSQSRVVRQ
jgi:hypothetical protein